MIRKATPEDIDSILNMTQQCANYMIGQGVFQWNDEYPSKTAFLRDNERNELYVLEKNEDVIGCIVISTFMDAEYVPIEWLTPNHNTIYIHRLAVNPSFQGQGFAQHLMDFAECLAREQHFVSIRLDTFSQNKRNQKFYELRGYQQVGEIYFPKQSEHPFYCYEKVL